MKKILISGASSGIGKALADQLLQEGNEVFSLSRRILDREAYAAGGILHQIACDITDSSSLAQAFKEISEKTCSLDLVFSNAGFGIAGPLADTPKELVIRQFDVNVFSAIELIRQSIPLLEETKGRILITSSVAAVVSLPFQSFYSASKASLNMLALALNTELKPLGIKVVSIMPGDVNTSFPDHRQQETDTESRFSQRSAHSVARMEKDERTGTDPSIIARKIIRISKKTNPKPFYGLGFFYRLVLLLFKLLPVRLTNWIVAKMYALNDKLSWTVEQESKKT